MGGGIFGQDFSDKEINQTTYNTQATTQYGNAYGAAAGKKNVAATGLGVFGGIKLPKNKAGRNASITTGDTNFSIVNNDPSAAIAALQSNQALSTLSIGLAQSNANEALRTLQLLNSQHNVADAGGTGSQVLAAAASDGSAGSIASNFLSGITTTQKVVIGVLVAGTIGFVIYRLTK